MRSLRLIIALSTVLPLAQAAPGVPPKDRKPSSRRAAETPKAKEASAADKQPDISWDGMDGRALRIAWEKAGYGFNPAVKAAYLAVARNEARSGLAEAKKNLPRDFLAWVDSDPVVSATVYGARHNPVDVLTVLRSLELDLGAEVVRRKYTQLMLAMAVVHSVPPTAKEPLPPGTNPPADRGSSSPAWETLGISLAPRPLLQLRIPGDPLKPVNTHPKDRPLDVNDHIINFFEGRTVEVKAKKQPEGGDKEKPLMESVPMAACDVLADPKLQAEFNAYMEKQGQKLRIDCGDHVVFRDSTKAVGKEEGKGLLEAFEMFKKAYEAKGLLPADRDATPTLAETCAWLIRNDSTPMPAPEGIKRKWKQWPIYPLNAPWPTLLYLAQWRQPLRECQDLFERYRDKGEFHGYGEYIGGIAQQFDFQSARRLMPYPFAYGTFQMMLKDGGVCGTMANMRVRSELALGIPSTTAGQPGHCALVTMDYSPEKKIYDLEGGQFVTGGPDDTHPHMPWVLAGDNEKRPMVYHLSNAWMVNYGMGSLLDSLMAWKFYQRLPEADRREHGLALLAGALKLNPYNFLAADSAVEAAPGAQVLADFADSFTSLLSDVTKPGCPTDGLYRETVLQQACKRLATLPVPDDKALLARLAAITEKAGDVEAWSKYQTALLGEAGVRTLLLNTLKAGIADQRSEQGTALLARRIQAVVDATSKSPEKTKWLDSMLTAVTGHETFTIGKKTKTFTDPCVAVVLKSVGNRAEAEAREAARAKELTDAASRDLSKDS